MNTAAYGVGSLTMGTGQFCTKPGLLFLPEGHGLEDALRTAIEAVPAQPMLNARMRDHLETGRGELGAHAAVSAVAAGAEACTTTLSLRRSLSAYLTMRSRGRP